MLMMPSPVAGGADVSGGADVVAGGADVVAGAGLVSVGVGVDVPPPPPPHAAKMRATAAVIAAPLAIRLIFTLFPPVDILEPGRHRGATT
jgi:hypothetical protein